MPQSLSAIYLHAVFSTKDRKPFLDDPAFRKKAFAHLAEVTKRLDCPAVEVGGHTDHIHALVKFGRTITVADWIKETKRVSSIEIKQHISDFAWQGGYGVFSLAESAVQDVVAYIANQDQHHQSVSFQDELRKLMTEHGIEWDERYIWE